MPDNKYLEVNGEGLEYLKRACELLGGTAVGYEVDGQRAIIFYRLMGKDNTVPFPTPVKPSRIADIAWDWLQDGPADPGREPDIDGHCNIGWLLSTRSDVRDEFYVLAEVSPHWMIYHK